MCFMASYVCSFTFTGVNLPTKSVVAFDIQDEARLSIPIVAMTLIQNATRRLLPLAKFPKDSKDWILGLNQRKSLRM